MNVKLRKALARAKAKRSLQPNDMERLTRAVQRKLEAEARGVYYKERRG